MYLLVFMTNSKHVHLYWGDPLLFGPPNAYFWGGQDPPDPPGNRRACSKRTVLERYDTCVKLSSKRTVLESYGTQYVG